MTTALILEPITYPAVRKLGSHYSLRFTPQVASNTIPLYMALADASHESISHSVKYSSGIEETGKSFCNFIIELHNYTYDRSQHLHKKLSNHRKDIVLN